ncbi:hypothetical protein [Aggregatibacter kilianii]|uniref:hypothetical protein n=1 Tax=Aggregatibacter kilianii TaxID=2025884 RepID=UPI000D64F369|nr:hypothetical protein [Aggregatibacter kilianii]
MKDNIHLFKETINLKISKDNKLYYANMYLEEKSDRSCHIKISLPNETISVTSCDFFDCLRELKNEHPNILIHCKGYKKNVYPSRMTRQMGLGLKAYEMKLGYQATFNDLVGIFDFEDEDLTSSNKEQEEFYKKWLASL